ncbi:MAG: hypothetical protein WCM76_13455 [Bacteroidota bacterium]
MKNEPGNTRFLKLLCIITFLCSGFFIIASIGALCGLFMFFGKSIELAAPIVENPTAKTTLFFFSFLLGLFIISFTGAVMMFRRRRTGFVLYSIANGLLLSLQIISLMLVYNGYSLIAAALSTLFIILYASQLRRMVRW